MRLGGLRDGTGTAARLVYKVSAILDPESRSAWLCVLQWDRIRSDRIGGDLTARIEAAAAAEAGTGHRQQQRVRLTYENMADWGYGASEYGATRFSFHC